MKRLINSLFAVILSSLVLLGSGGFTVGKMICGGNGHATYSLGIAKDCCDQKGLSCGAITKSCCDLINVSYLLDDYNPSSKVNVSSIGFLFCQFLTDNIATLLNLDSKSIFVVSDIPPPDTKSQLYSLSSLRL